MMVSPGSKILWTCEPEVIHQLHNRSSEFIKPTKIMQVLRIYGPVITAASGEEGRKYRKIMAPSFNEDTHNALWNESLKQGKFMLDTWENRKKSIKYFQKDVEKLALYIFSAVQYSQNLIWTDTETEKNREPKDSVLSYSAALELVLENLFSIVSFPKMILGRTSPE